MDATMQQQWIEALRSGRYRQGNGFLCRDGAYCCLGVLCDLHPAVKWKTRPEAAHTWYAVYREQTNSANLPGSLADDLGIGRQAEGALVGLNDGDNEEERYFSFSEIADWIEENL